jgi:hypothetical protein
MPRFLIAWLFCLLTVSAVAGANAQTCTGKDLLKELETRDPSAYAAIQSEAAETPNGDAILWKIEKPGLPDSYLFGTVHVSDTRVTDTMFLQARGALASARTVAVELAEIRDKRLLAAAMMRQARFIAMPPGQTIWDVIPDADEDLIRQNPNLPPDRLATIDPYQPWVVAAMLAIPACEQARLRAGHLALDEMIAREAITFGVSLVGLEKPEDQLKVFSGMPLTEQAAYLVATARMGNRLDDYFETMIDLYMSRNLAALLPLSKRIEAESGGTTGTLAFFEKELIGKRNRNMMKAAKELLDGGGVFIAVGALHLPGKNGLVELIRGSGYKVSPSF